VCPECVRRHYSKKLNNLEYQAPNQNMNPWSNSKFLPEEELEILKKK
jgi:hypothetical protein